MSSLRERLTYEPVELNFGTSGLRGLVVDMTDLECYINTVGFLKFLEKDNGLKTGATVYLAGDLRDSTPRLMKAVQAAIEDTGYKVDYLGLIPTPALALYALKFKAPGIMVTGSHIPADRNGIKFYKIEGEVLKADEPAIKGAVAEVRQKIYADPAAGDKFTATGLLRQPPILPVVKARAAADYQHRYANVFGGQALAGQKIVFYQHSAVGRDLLVELLTQIGAEVIPVGRSDVFLPIDSENVTPKDQAYFRELAAEYPDTFAIVSTDGDSDRPFVVDETGEFHRGDVLGAVVAAWLEADFAAYPVSSSDAIDHYLEEKGIESQHTKIGSPYVISAMTAGHQAGKSRPVGWEVNGGFLTGAEFRVCDQVLPALPTRDAIFPIIVALCAALEAQTTVSQLFATLPQRFTGSGIIDNFPTNVAKPMVAKFATDTPAVRKQLATYFSPAAGFGAIETINTLDGIRIHFANGDIAHLRPSGNAPQLRIYSVANTQKRADEIVALAIAEPNGLFRQMEKSLKANEEVIA